MQHKLLHICSTSFSTNHGQNVQINISNVINKYSLTDDKISPMFV